MEFGTEFGAKSALVKVVREGPLYVLTMHENENRFTGPFMKSLVAALNSIHASHEKEGNPPAALVTVSSQDRIWSNGLDLAEAGSRGADYIAEFMRTLEKFLTFPMPTVAAINGHAFAGGFLLSLCHDYRTFRLDRGWLCMNEIDMPAPMSQGLLSVLAAKLPTTRDYRDVMLFGNRFVGEEALKRGFVDAAGKDPQEAIKLAKELGVKWAGKARAGAVMGMLKDEVVGTLLLSLSRLGSYLMFFFLASLLKYKYAKTELLGNRPGPRPTPEEMKRLQQNVAKGLMEDAKKAAAKI